MLSIWCHLVFFKHFHITSRRFLKKVPYILTKVTYNLTKVPYILTKVPYNFKKLQYFPTTFIFLSIIQLSMLNIYSL